MSGISSHSPRNSTQYNWFTPPYIPKALGRFSLDPCSHSSAPFTFASRTYSPPQDGLLLPWSGRVWLNPPYNRQVYLWLDKLSKHGNGIALIFARTETRSFFKSVWNSASSLLFIQSRLHFYHLDGTRAKANSGGPSALIAYGENNSRALKSSGIPGKFIPLR